MVFPRITTALVGLVSVSVLALAATTPQAKRQYQPYRPYNGGSSSTDGSAPPSTNNGNPGTPTGNNNNNGGGAVFGNSPSNGGLDNGVDDNNGVPFALGQGQGSGGGSNDDDDDGGDDEENPPGETPAPTSCSFITLCCYSSQDVINFNTPDGQAFLTAVGLPVNTPGPFGGFGCPQADEASCAAASGTSLCCSFPGSNGPLSTGCSINQ